MTASPMNPPGARVAVLILTLNQRETTLQCLSSLMTIQAPSFDVVLWDNGSEDGTAEAVREAFPDVVVHHHDSNLGVASGRNAAAALAMKIFNPTHLLFLDNDIVVEDGFIEALLAPFGQDDGVGQTQAKLRLQDDRTRINDGGGIKINYLLGSTRPVGYGEIDRGQYDRIKPCVACGGAMMVRADVFEQLHGFDPLFDPVGPEDIDFSLRLAGAGYTALYVPHAVAYHAVSHTYGKGYTALYARHKTRHWFLFIQRHAPRWERMVFLSVMAPLLFLKVLLRETARGNFGVFKGLLRGVSDVVALKFGKRRVNRKAR